MSDVERQILQELKEAARLALTTAKVLATELQVQRDLATQDRIQVTRLIVLVQRLIDAVDLNSLGTERLEQGAAFVAEDLAARQVRADRAPATTPGASADAALRSPGETAAEVAAALAAEPGS